MGPKWGTLRVRTHRVRTRRATWSLYRLTDKQGVALSFPSFPSGQAALGERQVRQYGTHGRDHRFSHICFRMDVVLYRLTDKQGVALSFPSFPSGQAALGERQVRQYLSQPWA